MKRMGEAPVLNREMVLATAERVADLDYAFWDERKRAYDFVSEQYAGLYGLSPDEYLRNTRRTKTRPPGFIQTIGSAMNSTTPTTSVIQGIAVSSCAIANPGRVFNMSESFFRPSSMIQVS
jgi:hypothetical protein